MKRSGLGVLLAAFFYSSALWAAEGCTVNAVHGAPTVTRDTQTTGLQKGASLQKNDLISTPTDQCRVDLSMNDLAGCRVLPGSKLKVSSWKQEAMSVQILDGNIILNLKKLPDSAEFKVETPTAIAAVRGTQFWGRVSRPTPENPITTFAVREGAVEITPVGGTQTFRIEPGKALDLKLGEMPAVRDALPAEMQAMEQAPSIPSQT